MHTNEHAAGDTDGVLWYVSFRHWWSADNPAAFRGSTSGPGWVHTSSYTQCCSEEPEFSQCKRSVCVSVQVLLAASDSRVDLLPRRTMDVIIEDRWTIFFSIKQYWWVVSELGMLTAVWQDSWSDGLDVGLHGWWCLLCQLTVFLFIANSLFSCHICHMFVYIDCVFSTKYIHW